jgi:hypothetical protein
MDIPIRIRPNPFLEQPKRVMERIQWEPRGFRRDKIKNGPKSFPRTTRKGYGKETTARLKVSEKTRNLSIGGLQML